MDWEKALLARSTMRSGMCSCARQKSRWRRPIPSLGGVALCYWMMNIAVMTIINPEARIFIVAGLIVDHGGDYDTEFLDMAMEDSLDYFKIRGASIAFFDEVKML